MGTIRPGIFLEGLIRLREKRACQGAVMPNDAEAVKGSRDRRIPLKRAGAAMRVMALLRGSTALCRIISCVSGLILRASLFMDPPNQETP
jgi:hypothetical protein